MSSDWIESTVGEFCPFSYGKGLPERIRNPGEFSVISSAGVVGTHEVPLVNNPGVVIGRKGTVGSITFSAKPFWPIDTSFYIEGANSDKDIRYIYYLLQTLGLENMNSDSAVPGLNRDAAHSLRIRIPQLAEQKRISSALGMLDDRISLLRDTNRTLDFIVKTIFRSWFIDFGPVEAKSNGMILEGVDRISFQLFPSTFEDSEWGQIPAGWKVDNLDSYLSKLESGRRPKGGVSGIHSGVPSIGAESIDGIGVYDFSKIKYVPINFYESMKTGLCEDYDVLLYKDGGKPGEFKPRVGMYGDGFPFEKYSINEHVFRMRSKTLGQPYLYFTFCSERILNELANRGGKAAIPGINQTDVKTLKLLVPTAEIIERFNSIAMGFIKTILSNSSRIKTLSLMRDALLPRLISGEVRIEQGPH